MSLFKNIIPYAYILFMSKLCNKFYEQFKINILVSYFISKLFYN